MKNLRFKSLFCFIIIQNMLLSQATFCFAQSSDCLSPQLAINYPEIQNSYLLTSPLAQVAKQLFFTPPKRFIPFATRLYSFYNKQEKYKAEKIVQLQIMSGCSSRCLLCEHGPENFSDNLKSMPFAEINRHLDILKAAGVKAVSLCLDFEPFYYNDNGKDICDVMELVHSKGMESWLITHGWQSGELIPRKAAERLASLPFSVYILVSYHIWHNDVLQNPDSEQVKLKYIERFSEVINILSTNPQTGKRSNVQIEYRYVSDRMEKFKKINALQLSIWQVLKNRFNISDDSVDYDWPIEWSKGLAANIAKRFDVETVALHNNFGWLDRELQNIHFVVKIDGNMYLLVESLALERVDLDILLGDLIKKGYSVIEDPHKINEVFWYRILTPEQTIINMKTRGVKRIKIINSSSSFRQIEQSI